MNYRDLNWRILVGTEEFSMENPKDLYGEIEMTFNSVGACVSGKLNFNSYKDWEPCSRIVQIFVNNVRVGLYLVGLVSTTLSQTGGRQSSVPLVGLDIIDRDGLVRISLGTAIPEVGVASGFQNLYSINDPRLDIASVVYSQDSLGFTKTETVYTPPPYDETVDGGMKRVFNGNPLASWGVKPDGKRVSGIASGGTNYTPNGSTIRVQPANYEFTSYISEYGERAGDRWQPSYYQRQIGPYMPRRGKGAQSEQLLGDSQSTPPVTLSLDHFDGNQTTFGRILGIVNVYNLLIKSAAYDKVRDATYLAENLSVTVEVTFSPPDQPTTPPEGWAGTNITPLNTWQDTKGWNYLEAHKARYYQGYYQGIGGNGVFYPLNVNELKTVLNAPEMKPYYATVKSVADANGNTQDINKDYSYWSSIADLYYPTSGERTDLNPQQKIDLQTITLLFAQVYSNIVREKYWKVVNTEYQNYLSDFKVNLIVAEWMTTSSTVSQITPVIRQTDAHTNPYGQLNEPAPIRVLDEYVYDVATQKAIDDFRSNRSNRAAFNPKYDLDPSLDPGVLKGIYRNFASLTLSKSERVFTYTFDIPVELLSQVDSSLTVNYSWAFSLIFSTVKFGLTASAKVVKSVYTAKKQLNTTNIPKDLPEFNKPPIAVSAVQGVLVGIIDTGPFQIEGRQMTNATVKINNGVFGTEFQAGAPNGGV